jgi:putative nucleotidyltransferase with HDIG domain
MATKSTQRVPESLTIPTLPIIVQRVNQLIDDPRAGTREIGTVLAEDAPLAAKVLRIANSAYYGLQEPCMSAQQASSVLGVRALRNAVAQAAVIRQFDHLRSTGFDMDALWRHSILTAQACSHLAYKSSVVELTPDEFYSCGLLHDIGKVVMLDKLGDRYADIVRRSEVTEIPLHVAERDELGYDHTDVGSIVAERWGLPIPVAAAIQFHHGPREAVRDSAVVSLVANTNLIVHHVTDGDLAAAASIIDSQTASFLGLRPDSIADTIAYFAEQHSLIEI